MKDYSGKSLSELSREEVAEIIKVGEKLPKELSIVGWDDIEEDELVDDSVLEEQATHEWVRENFVGKCFMDTRQTIVLKVLRVRDSDGPDEFLFEEFDKDDKTGSWGLMEYYMYEQQGEPKLDVHGPDHVFVEQNVFDGYCMGNDGNLYLEKKESGMYIPLRPIEEEVFNKIKAEVYEDYKLGY